MIYQAAMRGSAGASTFAPDDIAGLQLWLDASDESTITASSGAVSQWDDKSGNARHFTQGTAASQPTTGTRTLNGKNAVDFASDYLNGPNEGLLDSPFSAFTVWLADTDEIAGGTITNHRDTDANERRGLYADTRTTPNRVFLNDARTGEGLETLDAAGKLAPSTAIITAVTLNASSDGTAYVDGTETDSQLGFGDPIMNRLVLGRQEIGPSEHDGLIAEVLVYGAELSASDRGSVESYLAAKWGVTLS